MQVPGRIPNQNQATPFLVASRQNNLAEAIAPSLGRYHPGLRGRCHTSPGVKQFPGQDLRGSTAYWTHCRKGDNLGSTPLLYTKRKIKG